MNRLLNAFGPVMSAAILLLAGIWIIGMIVGPQLIMVEQSFWHKDRGGDAVVISSDIDRLYNDIDMLSFDRSDAEALESSSNRDEKILRIDARITEKQVLIGELEALESTPRKVYSFRNYSFSGLLPHCLYRGKGGDSGESRDPHARFDHSLFHQRTAAHFRLVDDSELQRRG